MIEENGTVVELKGKVTAVVMCRKSSLCDNCATNGSCMLGEDGHTRLIEVRNDLIADEGVAKVSVVGIGMRSHTGVAAKMFRVLSNEGINIKVITTSEIKISVLIDRKYMELAVQALHDAFGLDKAA